MEKGGFKLQVFGSSKCDQNIQGLLTSTGNFVGLLLWQAFEGKGKPQTDPNSDSEETSNRERQLRYIWPIGSINIYHKKSTWTKSTESMCLSVCHFFMPFQTHGFGWDSHVIIWSPQKECQGLKQSHRIHISCGSAGSLVGNPFPKIRLRIYN